jgi:hypothetical protein
MINTGATGVTDVSFGCVAGVFRFITGAPGYNGSEPYPINEDWSPNTYVWYEGFIIKDGLSNPSRQVDVSVTGDYGVLSGFNFTIRNTEKFWNFVKTNNIYLVNKTVKFYTVISDTFFQTWQGSISNNPYDEVNYQFQCSDEFRKIHKNFPPNVITNSNYADSGVDQSQTMPVSLGDIPYAKLMKVEDITENFDVLTINGANEIKTTAAVEYVVTSSTYMQPQNYLYLITEGKYFDSNALAGHYLVVSSGTNADTERIIKIKSSMATIKASGKWYHYTMLTLEEPLQVTTPATFNSDYAYDCNGAGTGSTSDTWWFKTFTLTVTTKASDSSSYTYFKKDNQVQLWSWNKDTLKFDDIKDNVKLNESTGDLQLLSNNVGNNGEVIVSSRVPCTIDQAWCFITQNSSSALTVATSTELSYLTDLSREKVFYYGTSTSGSAKLTKIGTGARISPLDPENIKDYDTLYLGVDWLIKEVLSFTTWCKIRVKDCFGKYNGDLEQETQIYPATSFANPTSLNFISNEYYRNSTNSWTLIGDNQSVFGKVVTIDSSDVAVYTQLALSDKLLEALKAGTVTEIDVEFYIEFTTLASQYLEHSLRISEMGFLGERKISTVKGDVYSRIKGETTHSQETNNIYNVFRHILEDYDGLTDAQLDYGNLAATRNSWHVGRQILDRKTSFEYLQELCKHSFVCLFPGRTGKRMLSAWREDTTTPAVHDESIIVRDSIKNWIRTKVLDLFNTFKVKYNWYPAISDFNRAMFVDKVDQSSFPTSTATDSDGTLSWTKYFGGLDSYSDAKAIWEICHESYLRANIISSKISDDITKLNYFIDVDTFSTETSYNVYKGTKSSAYLYLKNLVEWTSRQKDLVTYNLPLDSIQVKNELLMPVYFSDTIYTNSVQRKGWITKIEVDTKKDQLVVTSTLEPEDIINVDDDIIIETGSAPDRLLESGSQPNEIIEV